MKFLIKKLQEIRHATANDAEARQLLAVIMNGWPEQKDQLPLCVRPYFSFRDTLSHANGLILKDEWIFIPYVLVQIKSQLHSAHLIYDSMIRRARKP